MKWKTISELKQLKCIIDKEKSKAIKRKAKSLITKREKNMKIHIMTDQ